MDLTICIHDIIVSWNLSGAAPIGIFWVVEKFPSDTMAINFIYSSMEATLKKKGYRGSLSAISYVNEEELMDVSTNGELRITFLPEGEFLFSFLVF